jgi:hypothetical protein
LNLAYVAAGLTGVRAVTRQTVPSRRSAASQAIDQNTMRIDIPCVGVVHLPEPRQIAFYGGLVALAALEVVEWPIAVVIAVGHLLAEDRHNRVIHDFGEALEEA